MRAEGLVVHRVLIKQIEIETPGRETPGAEKNRIDGDHVLADETAPRTRCWDNQPP